MMTVYYEAIRKSREESGAQYVLTKGFDSVIRQEGAEMLSYLMDGYEITGRFISGTEYDDYIVRQRDDPTSLVIGIRNLFLRYRPDADLDSEKIAGYWIQFWTHYDHGCKPCGTGADFYVINTSATLHESITVDDPDEVDKMCDYVKFVLNLKQDKQGVMKRIRKDLESC